MKNLLLILTLLFFSAVSPSYGQAVMAKIVADKEVNVGDLVVLDGTHSTNAVHYVWKLLNSNKKFLVFENGTKLITAIGEPGDYRFLLIVVGQDNNNRITVSDVEWSLKVIGDIKPDPVKPDPVKPDPVKPTVPDDEFNNLGKSIMEWSKEYLKPSGVEIVAKIGDNYKIVGSKLTNGDILLKDTFSEVAKLNTEVYPNQGVHDQFILVGSRINTVYTELSSGFDRDTMVSFLNVVGDAFKALGE